MQSLGQAPSPLLASLRVAKALRPFACAVFLIVIAASIAILVYVAPRTGLWIDEMYSVAIATGHSLEHAPSEADSTLGDYVETRDALPPSVWRRYTEHESPPASVARIVRAVFLADTHPPLYYVLLSWWMRAAGTGDLALRLFSVLATAACFPLLWSFGRAVGGRATGIFACLLFAFAPTVLWHSVDGRMYSLSWLFGLALGWSSLELHRRGARPLLLISWTLAGAAALLTHYFLAFVWCACAAWLLLAPGKMSRWEVASALLLSLALVLPWYLHLPENLAAWRVNTGWLDRPLTSREMVLAPVKLTWSMIGPERYWNGSAAKHWLVLFGMGMILLAAIWRVRRAPVNWRLLLPCMWFVASVFGVILFDVLRGTHASLVSRYAVPGLPALLLLVAFTLSRMRRDITALALLLVAMGWGWNLYQVLRIPAHSQQPFLEIARHIDEHAVPGDVVVVRSIPSGVLALARYMKNETPIVSWVEQSGVHGEEDVERLTQSFCRIVLVSIHAIVERNTIEASLRARSADVAEAQVREVPLLYFRPAASGHRTVQCPNTNRAARVNPSDSVGARQVETP